MNASVASVPREKSISLVSVAGIGIVLSAAISYWLAVEIGFMFRAPASNVPVVWPAAGIAVAALLLVPQRLYWATLAGLLATDTVAAVFNEQPWELSLQLTSANAVEMLIVTLLARRLGAPTLFADDVRTLLRVFFVPALLGVAAGATLGAYWVSQAVGTSATHEFGVWIMADLVAMFVVTPCVVFWSQAIQRDDILPTRAELTVLLSVVMVTAFWMAVGEWLRPVGLHRPYVLFPLLFWCTLYCPPRYAATLLVVLGAVAIYAAVHGSFGMTLPEIRGRSQLLRDSQAFVSVLAVSTLLSLALVRNKHRSDALLRRSYTDLEGTVARRTQQLLSANNQLQVEINAREEVARMLADSEAEARVKLVELETIYRTANVGLCLIDRDLRYVRINESLATVNGIPAEMHIGKTIFDIIPNIPANIPDLLRHVFETGEELTDVELESVLYTPAGAMRRFVASYYPVETARGRCVGCIVRETTDMVEMERELERHRSDLAHAARMNLLGWLATGLAHEINQPLHAIANYAQGCLRRMAQPSPEPNELVRAVTAINHESHRAAEIIRNLRDLAMKQPPRSDAVDLHLVTQHVLRLLRSEIKSHKTRLTVDIASDLPAVRGDAIQLEQVLLNLMLNAIEANKGNEPHNRSIALAAQVDEMEVQLTVSDNGRGVVDAHEKLFEPFFSTRDDGLGMGLSISRAIVERHGGRLVVGDNAPQGAVFTVTLPIPRARIR